MYICVCESVYITTCVYIFCFPVKAGGKRVVTKHKPTEKEDPDAYDQKYIDQLPEQA